MSGNSHMDFSGFAGSLDVNAPGVRIPHGEMRAQAQQVQPVDEITMADFEAMFPFPESTTWAPDWEPFGPGYTDFPINQAQPPIVPDEGLDNTELHQLWQQGQHRQQPCVSVPQYMPAYDGGQNLDQWQLELSLPWYLQEPAIAPNPGQPQFQPQLQQQFQQHTGSPQQTQSSGLIPALPQLPWEDAFEGLAIPEIPTYSSLGAPEQILHCNGSVRDQLPLYSAQAIQKLQQQEIATGVLLHSNNESYVIECFRLALGLQSIDRHVFERYRQMPKREPWMARVFSSSSRDGYELTHDEVKECDNLLQAGRDLITIGKAMRDLCKKALFVNYYEDGKGYDKEHFLACCDIEGGKWYLDILHGWSEDHMFQRWQKEKLAAGINGQPEPKPFIRRARIQLP